MSCCCVTTVRLSVAPAVDTTTTGAAALPLLGNPVAAADTAAPPGLVWVELVADDSPPPLLPVATHFVNAGAREAVADDVNEDSGLPVIFLFALTFGRSNGGRLAKLAVAELVATTTDAPTEPAVLLWPPPPVPPRPDRLLLFGGNPCC